MYRGFKQDMIACLGEFVGTTMFIFLGLGCVKTAQVSRDSSELQTTVTLSNQSLVFISLGMGFSLLITAWVFYRITGGLFNPAVTFSLWLIGSLKTVRAILLTIVQFAGGIAGSALVAGLTSGPGVDLAITKLEPGMSKVRGTFLEAFLTAMLVFTVLMLAAEKHKATYLAPIGIGLTLFVCQLFATLWTGCGMNPARSLGPSAVAGSFPGYHWIYYVGPYIGSLIATTFYWLLKSFDYTSVVSGQDSSDEKASPHLPARPLWTPSMGFTRQQRTSMLASGMHPAEIERREAEMVDAYNAGQNGHGNAHVNSKYSPQPRHSDATMVNMHPSGPNGTSLGIVHQNEAPAIRQVSQGATKTTRKTKSTGTGSTGNHAAQDYRHATTGTAGAPHRDASPMQPMMQDTGGIAAPGAHSAGLGNVPIFKKVLGHTNHNAHR